MSRGVWLLLLCAQRAWVQRVWWWCVCASTGGGLETGKLGSTEATTNCYGARWRPTEQGEEEKTSRRTEAHRGTSKEGKIDDGEVRLLKKRK